ncbi:Imm7 family immunity protein [Marinigracilibium pacificum]|uniref:Uncharacterized protein n=1 Tax=Marinigracilibium pacificum TaxID=2729599 RepID=A0A848J902_9BACT|nr:Imm7 family immunity protein [Marinigracilibium pacificum]NMM50859.1 hypothetical protein [Marinigracilibium pacificum]
MTMKYHGWVEIENQNAWKKHEENPTSFTYTDYLNEIHLVKSKLQSLINENHFGIPSTEITIMESIDDLISVCISGQRNHWRSGPIDLLNWIKDNAPYSHGQIHINDDEHGTLDNRYIIYRLANNIIEELIDENLYPTQE